MGIPKENYQFYLMPALDPEKPELWDDLGLVFNAMSLWGDAIDQAAIEYEKIISCAQSKEDLLQPISALTAVLEENLGLAGARHILQKLKDAVKQK